MRPRHYYALATVGVWKCTDAKQRIWVDTNMQRWVPYDNPRWIVVRHKEGSNYGERVHLKDLAYHCPSVRSYLHKSVLRDATIVDKDGDRHEMLYPRTSDITRVRCKPN